MQAHTRERRRLTALATPLTVLLDRQRGRRRAAWRIVARLDAEGGDEARRTQLFQTASEGLHLREDRFDGAARLRAGVDAIRDAELRPQEADGALFPAKRGVRRGDTFLCSRSGARGADDSTRLQSELRETRIDGIARDTEARGRMRDVPAGLLECGPQPLLCQLVAADGQRRGRRPARG